MSVKSNPRPTVKDIRYPTSDAVPLPPNPSIKARLRTILDRLVSARQTNSATLRAIRGEVPENAATSNGEVPTLTVNELLSELEVYSSNLQNQSESIQTEVG